MNISEHSTEHHIQDTVQPLWEYPEEQGNDDDSDCVVHILKEHLRTSLGQSLGQTWDKSGVSTFSNVPQYLINISLDKLDYLIRDFLPSSRTF